MTETQPIAFQAAIVIALNAILGVIVVMGWVVMTPIQVAAWEAMFTAVAVAIGAWWATRRTTPKAKPIDDDGTPLIRADNHAPTKRAEEAGRYVVRDEINAQARRPATGDPTADQIKRGVKPAVNWNK